MSSKKQNKTKKILGSMAEGWKRFQELDSRTLVSIRNGLIGALLADMFIVIWFFKQQQMGIFIFLLIIVFLSLTLLVEKKNQGNLPQEVIVKDPKNPKKPEEKPGLMKSIGSNLSKSMDEIQDEMRKSVDMSQNKSIV